VPKITPKFLSNKLYDVAQEHNLIGEISNSLESFYDLINKSAQFKSFLQSKKITNSNKILILKEIFGNEYNSLVFDLILYAKNSQVVKTIKEVSELFSTKYKASIDIVNVHATVAEDWSNKQKEQLKNSIDEILKKNAEIKVSVDKTIIGGIRLKIDNTFLDASIQNQLQMLKNKLLLS
jgi:F-type H+-transporting ATPase subunit delta